MWLAIWHVISGLCTLASPLYALWALVWSIPALTRKLERSERRLSAYRLANRETRLVALSVRETFRTLGQHVHMDPKLTRLLTELAASLPDYVEELPWVLMSCPVDCPLPGESQAAPRYYFPPQLRLMEGTGLDKLVADINDPVLTQLWEIRTPSALCEMLRHALFLAYGNPRAVSTAGTGNVQLNLPTLCSPEAGEAANTPQGLQLKHGDLWNEWTWLHYPNFYYSSGASRKRPSIE